MIWVSLEVQGTPKGTGSLGNPVFTPNEKMNSAEVRTGGLRERKSCVGKNLCALAPLPGCPGCPETDSGAWQKHTSDRKGGCREVQLAAAHGHSPALPPRPQPTESPGPGPGKTLLPGRGSALCRRWGLGAWSGAHLCVRHDSAHSVGLLLQGVVGKVREGHRAVLCGSVSNLEGPERMLGGSWPTAEGRDEPPQGAGGHSRESEWWGKRYNW